MVRSVRAPAAQDPGRGAAVRRDGQRCGPGSAGRASQSVAAAGAASRRRQPSQASRRGSRPAASPTGTGARRRPHAPGPRQPAAAQVVAAEQRRQHAHRAGSGRSARRREASPSTGSPGSARNRGHDVGHDLGVLATAQQRQCLVARGVGGEHGAAELADQPRTSGFRNAVEIPGRTASAVSLRCSHASPVGSGVPTTRSTASLRSVRLGRFRTDRGRPSPNLRRTRSTAPRKEPGSQPSTASYASTTAAPGATRPVSQPETDGADAETPCSFRRPAISVTETDAPSMPKSRQVRSSQAMRTRTWTWEASKGVGSSSTSGDLAIEPRVLPPWRRCTVPPEQGQP